MNPEFKLDALCKRRSKVWTYLNFLSNPSANVWFRSSILKVSTYVLAERLFAIVIQSLVTKNSLQHTKWLNFSVQLWSLWMLDKTIDCKTIETDGYPFFRKIWSKSSNEVLTFIRITKLAKLFDTLKYWRVRFEVQWLNEPRQQETSQEEEL